MIDEVFKRRWLSFMIAKSEKYNTCEKLNANRGNYLSLNMFNVGVLFPGLKENELPKYLVWTRDLSQSEIQVKKKIDLVFGEDVEDRATWKSIGVK